MATAVGAAPQIGNDVGKNPRRSVVRLSLGDDDGRFSEGAASSRPTEKPGKPKEKAESMSEVDPALLLAAAIFVQVSK